MSIVRTPGAHPRLMGYSQCNTRHIYIYNIYFTGLRANPTARTCEQVSPTTLSLSQTTERHPAFASTYLPLSSDPDIYIRSSTLALLRYRFTILSLHIYVHLFTYTYMYIYIFIYIHIYTSSHIYTPICIHEALGYILYI